MKLPWWLNGKKSACQCRRHRSNPWIRKIAWRKKWWPTSIFLSGESHGQSLVSYSPGDHKRVRHNLATKQQTAISYRWFSYLGFPTSQVPCSLDTSGWWVVIWVCVCAIWDESLNWQFKTCQGSLLSWNLGFM